MIFYVKISFVDVRGIQSIHCRVCILWAALMGILISGGEVFGFRPWFPCKLVVL